MKVEDLKPFTPYLNGNSQDLESYFRQILGKTDLKFLYIGD